MRGGGLSMVGLRGSMVGIGGVLRVPLGERGGRSVMRAHVPATHGGWLCDMPSRDSECVLLGCAKDSLCGRQGLRQSFGHAGLSFEALKKLKSESPGMWLRPKSVH